MPPDDISSPQAFAVIQSALRDPGGWCARLTSFPRGTRQMEPMERWQTRAVMAALAKYNGPVETRTLALPGTGPSA